MSSSLILKSDAPRLFHGRRLTIHKRIHAHRPARQPGLFILSVVIPGVTTASPRRHQVRRNPGVTPRRTTLLFQSCSWFMYIVSLRTAQLVQKFGKSVPDFSDFTTSSEIGNFWVWCGFLPFAPAGVKTGAQKLGLEWCLSKLTKNFGTAFELIIGEKRCKTRMKKLV